MFKKLIWKLEAIHVANDGDDHNPGTIEQPIRSVGEAKRRMTPGRPNVVLFKRGDRWGAFGSASGISGASVGSELDAA